MKVFTLTVKVINEVPDSDLEAMGIEYTEMTLGDFEDNDIIDIKWEVKHEE